MQPKESGAGGAAVQSKPKLGIYTTILLTRKIQVPFRIIGRNVKTHLNIFSRKWWKESVWRKDLSDLAV